MTFAIASLYAGLLGLLLLALSMNVSRERGRARVSLGDGGDEVLNKAIRAQANFTEYVPLALILIALSEAQGAPAVAVHILGAMLVVGRFLHAAGMLGTQPMRLGRLIGTVLTFLVLLIAGAGLAVHAVL